ncbi:MAG: 4Fe-4S dicluster domain-containing protein [Magnetococcales bacterium]|nr:4Fe-4S dicluster domain-containing protein [Magnetococcales bacterium]
MSDLRCDVLIVGAGPAGLATALRLARAFRTRREERTIMVLEKAARIGGHQLSGALLDPRDLYAVIDAHEHPLAPLGPRVARESLRLFTPHHALPLPNGWHHADCHLVSLGLLCRWLGSLAEATGVEIYPGFVAARLLWEGNRLLGVTTGDQGRDAQGRPKPGFQPGVVIRAPVTILAEGCRGHLTGEVVKRLGLDRKATPQTCGLGFKELWETPVDPASRPGEVLHALGWPLPAEQHGGGFLYRFAADRLAVGWIGALDYRDAGFDPFLTFQRWKGHPWIRRHLAGGRPLAFGARTLVEGGWQCLPELTFDGGALVGDGAGFLNAARLQGIGNGLRSGLAAAEGVLEAFERKDFSASGLRGYPERVARSDWFAELKTVRNLRPGFRFGLAAGLAHGAWEWFSQGRAPWTWRWSLSDRARLRELSTPLPCSAARLDPAPWVLDRPGALALSGLTQREDQPVHLRLGSLERALTEGGRRFANPETRYCPAGVYEVKQPPEVEMPVMRIHGAWCLHCKCCDIKDPLDNIRWTPPEGGGGPDYGEM